ncbi:hypothetical protein THRCLA_23433 [Thraustotheca clavata]|uniref:DDE Tnp4 domain-containing protein n=1 Tax=Thraustotheca clavata TaxID=74557 RepID=A0A1V9Y5E3_9STRA|nr:hypothetical protein THRCLA_23433 [Thraustotheca clavata]
MHIKSRTGILPGCIGFVDGTLFPLESKPMLYGEDYYSRKGNHAISALIVCDDLKCIRYCNVGFPRAAQNQRVASNSNILLAPNDYFDGNEYIVGDSTYTPNVRIVPCHKKVAKDNFKEITKFLTKFCHRRELLCRFQSPKSLRYNLDSADTMKKIIKHTCMIFHNLCIKDQIPSEWIHSEQDDTRNENNVDTVSDIHHIETVLRSGKARHEALLDKLLRE